MVRKFGYRGQSFVATVHGKPGKEEIFIVHMLEDDEEGGEISLDRFEDADNDPNESLECMLERLAARLMSEQGIPEIDPSQAFAWNDPDPSTLKRVHNGIQHR